VPEQASEETPTTVFANVLIESAWKCAGSRISRSSHWAIRGESRRVKENPAGPVHSVLFQRRRPRALPWLSCFQTLSDDVLRQMTRCRP